MILESSVKCVYKALEYCGKTTLMFMGFSGDFVVFLCSHLVRGSPTWRRQSLRKQEIPPSFPCHRPILCQSGSAKAKSEQIKLQLVSAMI